MMMARMMRSVMCMNPLWAWSMADCSRTARKGQGAAAAAPPAAAAQPRGSILEAVEQGSSFSTLKKALETAGLTEFLKGDGPFTVFAPTDDAFSALPAGALEDLLKPENREKLVSTLKYHVAAGRILSGEVVRLGSVRTFGGRDIQVRAQGGAVLLDNALVVRPDVRCSNGVIHVIDGVLIPR